MRPDERDTVCRVRATTAHARKPKATLGRLAKSAKESDDQGLDSLTLLPRD